MTTEKEKPRTLRQFLDMLSVDNAIGHLDLILLPLWGEGQELDYMLGSIAIGSGHLKITEVSPHGNVPDLLVESTSQSPILLIDGEELVGAKQDRILNTSLLVPPRGKMTIPVSCVEQGRWNFRSGDFKPGSVSPARVRATKHRGVTDSFRREGVPRSDQSAVWEEVAACLDQTKVASPTKAMHDIIQQRQSVLKGYTEALRYPGRARGIVAAINGTFAALDLFDKPETLELIWDRLVTGYAMDALAGSGKSDRTLTTKGAAELLERIGHLPCQVFKSPGLGEDWRFEAEDVLGQALVADDVCVHLGAFPNEKVAQGDPPGSRRAGIMPPSLRRRSHRSGR